MPKQIERPIVIKTFSTVMLLKCSDGEYCILPIQNIEAASSDFQEMFHFVIQNYDATIVYEEGDIFSVHVDEDIPRTTKDDLAELAELLE